MSFKLSKKVIVKTRWPDKNCIYLDRAIHIHTILYIVESIKISIWLYSGELFEKEFFPQHIIILTNEFSAKLLSKNYCEKLSH